MEKELIARVKSYNQELKQVTSEASNLAARVSYTEEDLTRRCQELSQLLGINVTMFNLEAIYEREIDKVESNLKEGEEILNRIRNGQVLDEEAERISKNILAQPATPAAPTSNVPPTPTPATTMDSGVVRRQSVAAPVQTVIVNNTTTTPTTPVQPTPPAPKTTPVSPSPAAPVKSFSPFAKPITPQSYQEFKETPEEPQIPEPTSTPKPAPTRSNAPDLSNLMGGVKILDV